MTIGKNKARMEVLKMKRKDGKILIPFREDTRHIYETFARVAMEITQRQSKVGD